MRIRFLFLQSWKAILENKLPYISLFIANIIGLILPSMILFIFASTYTIYHDSSIVDSDRTAVIALESDHTTTYPDGFEELLNGESYGIELTYRQTVFSDFGFSFSKVTMIDENYTLFYNFELSNGKFISPEEVKSNKRVCVISTTEQKSLFGENNPIGRRVAINDILYEVIGVLKEKTYPVRIFIPITTAPDYLDEILQEKFLLIKFDDPDCSSQLQTKICSFLSKNNIEFSFNWANDLFSNRFINIAKALVLNFTISLGLIIFVIINLGNIMYAVIDAEKKSLGIKFSLGASKRDLFIEKVFSNSIISLASVVTLAVVSYLITLISPVHSISGEGWWILLVPASLIAFLLSVIEGIILMKKMFSEKVINLLVE